MRRSCGRGVVRRTRARVRTMAFLRPSCRDPGDRALPQPAPGPLFRRLRGRQSAPERALRCRLPQPAHL